MATKFIDKSKNFMSEVYGGADRALNVMMIDIERMSKQQVPFKKGQLKSSGYHKRVGDLKYKIGYNKEYALFQHEGGDGKRVVRRYSHPGKKKHYLIDPAREVVSKVTDYLKQQLGNIRL
jgi:hypothetical protein